MWVANEWDRRRLSTAFRQRGLHRVGEAVRTRELAGRLRQVDGVLYLAHLGAARLLQWLDRPVPVVAHHHDLGPALGDELADPDDRAALLGASPAWIASSPAAATELEDELGVPASSISVAVDPVRAERCWSDGPTRIGARRHRARAVVDADLGIGSGALVVVGVAGDDDAERPERFAELACLLHLLRPGCAHLVWSGTNRREAETASVRAHQAGLDPWFHVRTGDRRPLPDAELVLAADALVLTDPTGAGEEAVADARRIGTPSIGFVGTARSRPDVGAGPAGSAPPGSVDLRTLALGVLTALDDRAGRGRTDPSAPVDWIPVVAGPRLGTLIDAAARSR